MKYRIGLQRKYMHTGHKRRIGKMRAEKSILLRSKQPPLNSFLSNRSESSRFETLNTFNLGLHHVQWFDVKVLFNRRWRFSNHYATEEQHGRVLFDLKLV